MKTIRTIHNTEIIAVKGSIFDVENVDLLALFKNVGMAALPIRITDFLRKNGLAESSESLQPYGKDGIRYIYYANTCDLFWSREIDGVVDDMLTKASERGLESIAMNGIRTSGWPEMDNLHSISNWLREHWETPIRQIQLVDLRGGFNKV